MFHNLLAALNNEVSGHAAKNLVARISQWHRIQASPMYREAAEWLHATLQSWGLTSQLERFPAREGALAWGEPMFQEWWCDEATLHLLEPDLRSGNQRSEAVAQGVPSVAEAPNSQLPTPSSWRKLADYRAVPLSLMPRSSAAEGE